jgi:hypothetical protein
MHALTTAGERVVVDCAVPRLSALLERATAGEFSDATTAGETIHVEIQSDRRLFDRTGWTLITRGAWAAPPRVLITDACSSGFDLLVEPRGPTLHVTARYRPAPRTRAANMLLASRFRLLAAQTLLHYPALWWASLRGRVPLHVSVVAGHDGVTMLAGPSGIGKSTLLAAGLPRGEIATADNLCACDTRSAYGLVEPLRVDGGRSGGTDSAGAAGAAPGRGVTGGRRTPGRPGVSGGPAAPHGRKEYPLPGRVPCLEPDRLVVLRRAPAEHGDTVRPISRGAAARELVAGTYMAGELRRFWPFCATLALATGLGPPHPDVADVAAALATRLPCLEVRMSGGGTAAPIGELLGLATAP